MNNLEMGDSKAKESTQQKPQKRQPPWMKIEVKGSGGILLLGGIFIATAFAAVRVRRSDKRLPGSGANLKDQVVANDGDVAIDEEKKNCGSLNKEELNDEELLREAICDVQEDMYVCEIDQNPRSSHKNSDISMDSMIDVSEVVSEICYSDIKEVLSDVCELHKIYLKEKNVSESNVIDIEKEQRASSDEMLSSNELQSEETNSTKKEEKEQIAPSNEMLSSNELQSEETNSTKKEEKEQIASSDEMLSSNELQYEETDSIKEGEKEQIASSDEMLSSNELQSEETNSTKKEEKEQSASSDEMLSSNEIQSEETNSTYTDNKPEEEESQIVMDVHNNQQNLDECTLSCANVRGCEEMFLADSQLSMGEDQMKETFNNSEYSVSDEETEDNETLSTESHLIDAESASDISSLETQSLEVQELKKDALEAELNFVMKKAELIQEMTEFEHVAKTNEDGLYVTKVAILSKVEIDAKDSVYIIDTNETGHDVIEFLQVKELIGGDAAPEFAPVKKIGEAEKKALQEATDASSDEEVKMTEEGSDGMRSLSVSCNAEAIWPAELVEQDKFGELATDSTDALSEVLEIEDKIHSEVSEEEEETCMTDKKAATANMSLIDFGNRFSFISNHGHKGISLLLAAITLLISIYLSQLLSTSVES